MDIAPVVKIQESGRGGNYSRPLQLLEGDALAGHGIQDELLKIHQRRLEPRAFNPKSFKCADAEISTEAGSEETQPIAQAARMHSNTSKLRNHVSGVARHTVHPPTVTGEVECHKKIPRSTATRARASNM